MELEGLAFVRIGDFFIGRGWCFKVDCIKECKVWMVVCVVPCAEAVIVNKTYPTPEFGFRLRSRCYYPEHIPFREP